MDYFVKRLVDATVALTLLLCLSPLLLVVALRMRPGITGLAQMSVLGWDARLALDVEHTNKGNA